MTNPKIKIFRIIRFNQAKATITLEGADHMQTSVVMRLQEGIDGDALKPEIRWPSLGDVNVEVTKDFSDVMLATVEEANAMLSEISKPSPFCDGDWAFRYAHRPHFVVLDACDQTELASVIDFAKKSKHLSGPDSAIFNTHWLEGFNTERPIIGQGYRDHARAFMGDGNMEMATIFLVRLMGFVYRQRYTKALSELDIKVPAKS